MIRTKFDEIRFCDTLIRGPERSKRNLLLLVSFSSQPFLRLYTTSSKMSFFISASLFSLNRNPLLSFGARLFQKNFRIMKSNFQLFHCSDTSFLSKKKINLLPANHCHFQSFSARNFGRYLSRFHLFNFLSSYRFTDLLKSDVEAK